MYFAYLKNLPNRYIQNRNPHLQSDFDSFAFLNRMSRFIMATKPWLKDLQHRKIARTLDKLTTYECYDPVNEKPLREVYLILYNAAYHHGTTVQINYKGKEESPQYYVS